MRIETGQHMRLEQKMKLAPRMIQSMEILQMPTIALEERIEQELSSNPTLELHEPNEIDDETLQAIQHQEQRDANEGERPLVAGDDSKNKGADDFERLNNIAEEYGDSWEANNYGASPFKSASANTGERDGKMDAMANTASRPPSLEEQLKEQWMLIESTPLIRKAGEFIIGNIDQDGYLRTPLDELLTQAPPNITLELLEETLTLFQSIIEPVGIGARNVRECLLLQIDLLRANQPNKPMLLHVERLLVSDYLHEIEANRLPKIARSSGLSLEQINQAKNNLKQFQFHPGSLLATSEVRTVTPDAIVEYDEQQDRYIAYLVSNRLPGLQINREYALMAKNRSVEKKTREFVSNNLRSATWLIDAIQQRQNTLLRVVNVVIEAQCDFFEQGPQALKPLPMTQVADQLGIHVATVSRTVNEKYIQSPRGIDPLRMFFSGGTQTDSGEQMSWTAIQTKLDEIITGEDRTKPFNDDELVEQLKSHGIEIARRTVAKYRKQLNIPSARQRKIF